MLKKIWELRKNGLFRGTFVLFIATNFFNFLNYIFQFSMARMLGPSDYGVLAVLMSLIYIFTIPSEAIQTIVSRYTSKYTVKKEIGKIKGLLYKSVKKGLVISSSLFLGYIPVTFFLSKFLNISFWLILVTGLFIFAVFSVPISRGVLQGSKKFKELGLNMVFEGLVKVGLSIFLVFMGMAVFGAVTGMIIAFSASFFIGLFFLKEVLQAKIKSIKTGEIYSYGKPTLIAMSSIILILSLDVIMAKRFFLPDTAGLYAVASMFGKLIFFSNYAVGKAMFPFTSEGNDSGKNTQKIFSKAIMVTSILAAAILACYLLIPKLVIRILFGAEYVGASNVLFIVGLGFAFLSLSSLFVLYKLSASTSKIQKSHYFLFIFVLLDIILLSIFNSTLVEFSLAFLSVNFLILLYSIILR